VRHRAATPVRHPHADEEAENDPEDLRKETENPGDPSTRSSGTEIPGVALRADRGVGGGAFRPVVGWLPSGRAATEHGPPGPRAASWIGPDGPVSTTRVRRAATGGALIS